MAGVVCRATVLGGYKRLLLASKAAFAGDVQALAASRTQLRAEFTKNRDVTDPTELGALVRGIDEAEEFLKFHIVQGRLNERGNYEIELEEKHGEGRVGNIQVEPAVPGDDSVPSEPVTPPEDRSHEIDLTKQ